MLPWTGRTLWRWPEPTGGPAAWAGRGRSAQPLALQVDAGTQGSRGLRQGGGECCASGSGAGRAVGGAGSRAPSTPAAGRRRALWGGVGSLVPLLVLQRLSGTSWCPV